MIINNSIIIKDNKNTNNFNNKIIEERQIKSKTENIDIKKKDETINIENNSYYTNSFDEFDNTYLNINDLNESLDEQDIEGIFSSYKVEFGTKSKTMRIIEQFNKDNL